MKMRQILPVFFACLLFSTNQASPTPDNDLHHDNSSCIQCPEEKSHENSKESYVTNLFKKSMEYLFGKPRYYYCCTDETRSTDVRDVSSDRNKQSACKITLNDVQAVVYTCGDIGKEIGKAYGGLFAGIIGLVLSKAEHGYWNCCRALKKKDPKKKVTPIPSAKHYRAFQPNP